MVRDLAKLVMGRVCYRPFATYLKVVQRESERVPKAYRGGGGGG